MSEKSVHIPLQLTWTNTQKFNASIFDLKHQQLDNFTLMMADLCQDSDLVSCRITTLLIGLFDIHNGLYCSSDETSIVPGNLEKSEKLLLEIDKEKTEYDMKALQVCSEAILLGSPEIVWKYLNAIFYGLKADAYFTVNEINEGNSARMEMLKLIYEYELFDTLDLVNVLMDYCSELLTIFWDWATPAVPQIDYLLLVARYLLDTAKLDDDFDGVKYQNLRKFWILVVGVNEGRFIDKSWLNLQKNGKAENDEKTLECVKFPIDLPEPPKILSHPLLKSPEDFLTRKKIFENHHLTGPFQINSELDSLSIMEEVSKYAQIAYESIKTNHE